MPVFEGSLVHEWPFIPMLTDQNPLAESRDPIELVRQSWPVSKRSRRPIVVDQAVLKCDGSRVLRSVAVSRLDASDQTAVRALTEFCFSTPA